MFAQILVLVLIAVALEVVLFWAAASLVDAPPLGWGKTLLVSILVTLVWGGATAAIAWSVGPATLAAPDNRTLAVAMAGLALGVSWMLPAVLYVPLVPVSIPRSMLLSVLQVLLRLFLYVLIAAVVMVVLALIQIARGTEPRADLLSPLAPLLAALA
jgi:hypothetical protein